MRLILTILLAGTVTLVGTLASLRWWSTRNISGWPEQGALEQHG